MAQSNSMQREPSMEEILASIRRIIEDSDTGRPVPEQVQAEPARPARSAALAEISDFEAFRPVARDVAEPAAPTAETPVQRPVADVPTPSPADSTASVLAELRPSLKVDAGSTTLVAAVEPALEAVSPSAAKPADMTVSSIETLAASPEAVAPSLTEETPVDLEDPLLSFQDLLDEELGQDPVEAATPMAGTTPSIISDKTGRQVAAAFGELSEAFAATRQKSFDEMAEAMIRPMLSEWLDNNLPTLVERLVREEIERIARGPAR